MILLFNGIVFGYNKSIDSVVIKNDKIFYIGEFNNIPNGEYNKKIDLKKKLLLPSFIDTHTHFSEYIKLKLQINFSKVKNIYEILTLINENPEKIKGYGLKISLFDKNKLAKVFKNITRKKVFTLASSDYHSYLITGIGLTDWPLKSDDFTQIKNNDLLELYKNGITSIHEMAFTNADFYAYDNIGKKLEVCRHFPVEMLDEMINNNKKSYMGDENLKLGSLKLFYDGSIGSSTAFLYSDILSKNKENKLKNIEKDIKKALINDLSVSVHAIGDRAVDDIVEIFIKHKKLIKNFVRIEHAQIIRDETIKKLEIIKDKVYLSMQPLHLREDTKILIKMELENYSFRFNSLRDLTIGFSSDVPVVEFNPFKAIYYAVTHNLNKREAITAEEAINNYTINAAKLSNSEDIKGSIEVGKKANLILIDDYKKYDENFWLNAKNYMTILGGKIVYIDF